MSAESNRPPIVIGNWKMNGSLKQAHERFNVLQQLVQASTAPITSFVICPPFVHLSELSVELTSPVYLGAQDVSHHAEGAYTGDINASMLKELGCAYVLVGHSERRQHHYESSEIVALKAKAACDAGLIPVICVGETLAHRQANLTDAVIEEQLAPVFDALTDYMSNDAKYIIAYEPVWAIGTGEAATPEQAQEVHAQIRRLVAKKNKALAKSIQILYGGSVKVDNAKSLFTMPDIDGFLVGGASLNPQAFFEISQMG